jgi:hypothetical protein
MKPFFAVASLLLWTASLFAADLRIGMIGLDTSHCIEFTRRINDASDKNHIAGGKVLVAFKGGSPDIKDSWDRLEKYTTQLQEKFGVRIVGSISEVCQQSDAILIESLDGRPKLEQFKEVLKAMSGARKPVFIDKPVAASLRDAIEIYHLAKQVGVPIYSGSSLRYYPTVQGLKNSQSGVLKGVVASGPCVIESHHPDLFWYGIHTTEALYAVMGPGCESVVCTATPDTHVVTGVWRDGKIGTVRGLRNATHDYHMSVFGSKAIVDQKLSGDYTPFLAEVMKFLQTGVPPVSPEETLEIYAFMAAADESKRLGGSPVKIAQLMTERREKTSFFGLGKNEIIKRRPSRSPL